MKKATITTCYNCHKPLSDISVAPGIGTDCWAQRMIDSGKSHYFANGLDGDFYYIGAKTYEQAKQSIHN